MEIVRIQERSRELNSYTATVSFNDGPTYPIKIHDPFTEEEEDLLEWYFEEYLHFPFTRKVRALEAAKSIAVYGEALFQQIFAHESVYALYQEVIEKGLNTLAVEVAGSPEFHRLHWEALKDPNLPFPLSVLAPITRKNLIPQKISNIMKRSLPTINVLV